MGNLAALESNATKDNSGGNKIHTGLLFVRARSLEDHDRGQRYPGSTLMLLVQKKEHVRPPTGITLLSLGERISELCEFIKDRRDVYQNTDAAT